MNQRGGPEVLVDLGHELTVDGKWPRAQATQAAEFPAGLWANAGERGTAPTAPISRLGGM